MINLNLLCLVGLSDPPRKGVKEAIGQCQASGITVRMITGDNITTAVSIAKEVGILNKKEAQTGFECNAKNKNVSILQQINKTDMTILSTQENSFRNDEKIYVMEGDEFRELSGGLIKRIYHKKNGLKIKYELGNKRQFEKCVENLKVIARASPEDKLLLVLGLKKLNNIVAVTGDGTNDAAALKKSDVGFSMGKRGTDIAKEASDIVLLDDSFSSIVTAIKYGRNVYDSIRKFLQFQLTTNIVAVFMTLFGGIILNDSPLNAIQMLWVNLIMDSFASLGLATEHPTDKLLERRPYNIKDPIITHMMSINIISQAVFQITVLTIIIFYGNIIFGVISDRELSHFEWNENNGYHFSIFFNIFVFLQVFNSINSRKLSKFELNVFQGIFNNKLYLIIQVFIIVCQIFMVQFGGQVLRTKPLTFNQHIGCVLIASLSLLVNLLIKLIPINSQEDNISNGEKLSMASTLRRTHSTPRNVQIKKKK